MPAHPVRSKAMAVFSRALVAFLCAMAGVGTADEARRPSDGARGPSGPTADPSKGAGEEGRRPEDGARRPGVPTVDPSSGPPQGVRLDGKLYETADILDGKVVFEKTLYIVGVVEMDSQKTLLPLMRAIFNFTATFQYSSLPMFAGVLDHEMILWLLKRTDVRSIENDGEVTTAKGDDEGAKVGPPSGVSVDGKEYDVAAIRDGHKVFLKPRKYIAVVVRGRLDKVLQSMQDELGFTPEGSLTGLSMFHGNMTQKELLWLLENSDVLSIEADGEVVALEEQEGSVGAPLAPGAIGEATPEETVEAPEDDAGFNLLPLIGGIGAVLLLVLIGAMVMRF